MTELTPQTHLYSFLKLINHACHVHIQASTVPSMDIFSLSHLYVPNSSPGICSQIVFRNVYLKCVVIRQDKTCLLMVSIRVSWLQVFLHTPSLSFLILRQTYCNKADNRNTVCNSMFEGYINKNDILKEWLHEKEMMLSLQYCPSRTIRSKA